MCSFLRLAFSRSTSPLRTIQVVTCINNSSLLIAKSQYTIVWMCHSLFNQLKDIWVDSSFELLQIKLLCTGFCVNMFYFTRIYIQKCNRWVYSSCMFCFIKNCQTVFQNNCTILDSYQQYMNIHSSVNPYQRLRLSLFFISAIMIGRWWCTIVVLICIAIVANDFKHLFTWLVATCVSFLVKHLFILLSIFQWGFCLFVCFG